MTLQFDEKKLEEVGKDFSNLTNVPEEVMKVVELTHALITRFIPIDPFPLKGFILRAMRKTQEELKFTGPDYLTFTPEERLEALNVTVKYLEEGLKMVLRKKVDSGLLSETINKAYEFAKKKLIPK